MTPCVRRFPRILRVHFRLHPGSLLTAFVGLTELNGELCMIVSEQGFTLPYAKDFRTSISMYSFLSFLFLTI